MEKYEFYYPHSNVRQIKVLIKHEDYLKFKILPDDSSKEEKRKKKLEKEITNKEEWFTNQSPLYDAITTGILNCNGVYSCIVNEVIDEELMSKKNKEIVRIIYKYMPVEGWKEAFINDLNNNGFRITYLPKSPLMIFKKIKKQIAWTD